MYQVIKLWHVNINAINVRMKKNVEIMHIYKFTIESTNSFMPAKVEVIGIQQLKRSCHKNDTHKISLLLQSSMSLEIKGS